MPDEGDSRTTIETYEEAAELYVRRTSRTSTAGWKRFVEEFVELVGTGTVLELGSGPGWHAKDLESRGVTVERSDATDAFVRLMNADGFDARRLNINAGDFGGPYDGIFANAVLLHLNRDQFVSALDKAAAALRSGGVFAFTLKEGDGEGWSTAKLDKPRFFTYWREQAVRSILSAGPWSEVFVRSESGSRAQSWLLVIARA